MNIEKLTTTELHAYVDQELSEEHHARITHAANSDPALKAEIDAIRDLKAGIADSFSSLKDANPPQHLVETVFAKPKYSLQRWATAACLVAGITGGYFLGISTQDRTVLPEQDWIAQVVNYQDMYTTETLAHVTSTTQHRDVTLARLSNALGYELVIPEFSDQNIEFKRGQILTSNEKPVIQLAFLDTATGAPIALCITPTSNSETGLINGSVHSMNYVNWRSKTLDFLVVGNFSHDHLQRLAQDARRQFKDLV